MYRVGDVAKMFSVSAATVRVWTKQFGDYLSPEATPESGEARYFTDDDLKVFRYVHYALQRGNKFDEVWGKLRGGEALKRFDEVFRADQEAQPPTAPDGAIVGPAEFTERYAMTLGRLGEVTEQRDRLRVKLAEEIDAHGMTRERAAAAEERARLLEAPRAPQAPPFPVWLPYVATIALLAIVALLVLQMVTP